jgi:hypothetical protein
VPNGRMMVNYEFGGVWKETFVTYLKVFITAFVWRD